MTWHILKGKVWTCAVNLHDYLHANICARPSCQEIPIYIIMHSSWYTYIGLHCCWVELVSRTWLEGAHVWPLLANGKLDKLMDEWRLEMGPRLKPISAALRQLFIIGLNFDMRSAYPSNFDHDYKLQFNDLIKTAFIATHAYDLHICSFMYDSKREGLATSGIRYHKELLYFQDFFPTIWLSIKF